jgi:hypothetical protein
LHGKAIERSDTFDARPLQEMASSESAPNPSSSREAKIVRRVPRPPAPHFLSFLGFDLDLILIVVVVVVVVFFFFFVWGGGGAHKGDFQHAADRCVGEMGTSEH